MSGASIREYAIKYMGKGDRGGTVVGGGNAVLATPPHALAGPEHTGQLPVTRLFTVETDMTFVASPDGTGGVLFRAEASSSDWYFNVKNYGALGDNSHDDTTAIQAAINDCPAYCTVFFPAGTYKTTATLTIPLQMRFLGAGAYPTWNGSGATVSMTTANTTAISASVTYASLSIEQMGIVGPGSATFGRGIYTSQVVSLRQVFVTGFYDGLYIDDSLGTPPSTAYYNHISESWFMSNSHDGIVLHDQVNNTTIRETYSAANGRYGIYANGGGYGLRLVDNSLEVNHSANICIDGAGILQSSEGAYLAGNYFEILASESPSATADILLGPTSTVYGVTIVGGMHVRSDVAAVWHIDANHVSGLTVVGVRVQTNLESGSFRANASNTTGVLLINSATMAGTITLPSACGFALNPAFAPLNAATAWGGDLSGTGSAPGVAKINGVSVTGTPSVGMVPTATSPSAATWQAPETPGPGGGGHILVTDTPAGSPLVFADLLQNDTGTDLIYADI